MIPQPVGEQQALQRFANSSLLSSNNHNPSSSLTVTIQDQQTVPWIWRDATRFCRNICPTSDGHQKYNLEAAVHSAKRQPSSFNPLHNTLKMSRFSANTFSPEKF